PGAEPQLASPVDPDAAAQPIGPLPTLRPIASPLLRRASSASRSSNSLPSTSATVSSDPPARPNSHSGSRFGNLIHESHSQAAPHPSAHSRLAPPIRLFADDARDRRSPRRQQGHGLRARGVAHHEGRLGSGSEQGSLFVH